MRKRIKQLVISILLAIVLLLSVTMPVLAIADPNAITFGSATAQYGVFQNVYEPGDMLFVAECYVKYNPTSEPDEAADEAFTFQVLNVAGDTVLLQQPIPDYQDVIVSIYQTKAQVDLAGYAPSAYKLRLAGNIALFGALTEDLNKETITLNVTSNWYDQSTASGTNSLLYFFIIDAIANIETEMVADHTVIISGVTLLDPSGAALCLKGIPSLNTFIPEMFQSITTPMTADDPAHTGAYQTALTPTAQLGANIATSRTSMATFLGVSSSMAGIVISTILAFVFLPVFYFKTRNGTLTMIVTSLFYGACGYFGLFPLAIAFIIAGIIVIITVFTFWGKIGA